MKETNNETNETNGNGKTRYRADGFSKIQFDLIYEKEEFNPRMHLDAIPELATDIWENGLREPIHIKEDGKGGYFVISGHRRRAAYDYLINVEHKDIKEVVCKVYLKNHSEEDLLVDAVVTNTGLPLLPLEQGKVISQFMKHYNWTPTMIANKLNFHVSVPTMYQRKNMWENCPMVIKEQLKNGEITVKEAQKLLKESSKEETPQKAEAREAKNAWNMRVRELLARIPENLTEEFEDVINELRKKYKVHEDKETENQEKSLDDIKGPSEDDLKNIKFEDDEEDLEAALKEEL